MWTKLYTIKIVWILCKKTFKMFQDIITLTKASFIDHNVQKSAISVWKIPYIQMTRFVVTDLRVSNISCMLKFIKPEVKNLDLDLNES